MYVAGRSHPLREPAKRLLERARREEIEAITSTEILQEILFRYTGLGRRDIAAQVYDLFVQTCPVVLPVTLADTDRAKEILTTVPGVSARDAVHAGVMINNDVEVIATFDTGFDRVPRVKRLPLD